jgi:acetoin utilization deacetylase AcuC-like enzyme
MGFCFFNNVAVAARHALDAYGCERVLVLDWDVHHGNGTNDIFHATNEVLFVSIHESPLYPGSGPASDAGSGRGLGYTVNLPVPSGSGDETFGSLVEHVVVPLAMAYEPRLLLVSAGFDAHRDDPLAGCRVTDEGFARWPRRSRGSARRSTCRSASSSRAATTSTRCRAAPCAVLETFGAPVPPEADPSLAVHPLATQALERLGARWTLPAR